MCVGWPDQDPALKPRLPLSVTLKDEVYDESGDSAGIEAYDEQMRVYYLERTNGTVDRTWTSDMSALLGKESRPHMRPYLEGQGLIHR